MLFITTNHKVGDIVYVVSDCVRRGVIQKVSFTEENDGFALSYQVLYDGYTYNYTVNSTVSYQLTTAGSPYVVGSPVGSPQTNPTGSPFGSPGAGAAGSPHAFGITVVENANGGSIYTSKSDALAAFGDTLA